MNLLSQATQPVGITWTPEIIIALVTAVSAAIVAIITALRAGSKAEVAKTIANEARTDAAVATADVRSAQKSLDRNSDRANAQDARVSTLELNSLPPFVPKGPTP